jgi:cobalamin synthase
MKTALKKTDETLQLVLLILIVLCGISLIGWLFLMVLFPVLAVVQLLSAGIRTYASYNTTEWNRRTLNIYWTMVGCWIIINTIVYLIPAINDVFFLTMMLLSMPIAIWYYKRIKKENVLSEEEKNTQLAATMKY